MRAIIAAMMLLVAAGSARAAITVDAASFVQGNSTVHTWPHSVGLGNNTFLVVGVSIFTSNKTVSTITYAGQSLSFLGARNGGSGSKARRIEMWYLVGPPTGTTDVIVTMSNGSKVVAGATSFFGVDPAAPLGAFVSAEGENLTPTVVVPSAADQLVIDCLAVKANTDPVTVGPGQAQHWNELTRANGGNIIGAASTEPGAATTTMSWSQGQSEYWVIGAASIKPAPPPPYQPDLTIKHTSESDAVYLINDYYENPALFQVKEDSLLNGNMTSFRIRIENDGLNADAFVVSGTGSGSGFTVQYLDEGGADRTASVTTGGYTLPVLLLGEAMVWTVNAGPGSTVPGGNTYSIHITATSSGSPLNTDQVSATVVSTAPSISLSKSADRANAAPGEDILYTVLAASAGLSDATSIVVVDSIPGDTGYRMGSASFNPGTSALVSNVEFSGDGGVTWGYGPVDSGCGAPAGYDFCVTHIRWTLTGVMTPARAFSVAFAVRIR